MVRLLDLRMPRGRLHAWRLRTSLSAAGIVVSVASMVLLLCASDTVFKLVAGGLSEAGGRTLYVVPSTQNVLPGTAHRPLSDADVRVLERRLEDVEAVAPLVSLSSIARACGGTRVVRVMGVLPLNEVVDSITLASGRFITDLDHENGTQVAVLGSGIPGSLPCLDTGASLQVGVRTVRVVGILRRKGQMLLGDFDNTILIPLRTAEQFQPEGGLSHRVIMLLMKPGSAGETVRLKAERALREARGLPERTDPGFEVITHTDVMKNMERIRSVSVVMSLAIAGVGLLIALIGLANSVFAGVVQRTSEIGLLRCVGARRRDIRWMFLFETLSVLATGIGMGTVCGLAAAYAVARSLDVPAVLSISNVVIPGSLTLVLGIVAGMWPAEFAARLDPAVALTQEQ